MSRMLTFLVLVAVTTEIWGDPAVFRDVKGKVEYRTTGGEWLPAETGVSIPPGTTISTGFKSSAALEVLGSVVFVKPLTRIVLEELLRNPGGTTTRLTLLAGKVKAEVKPSSATTTTDFAVKAPTATASVRGTGFEFDGVSLLVNHGEVEFSNPWLASRSVHGGEISSVGSGGTSVSAPVPVKPAERQALTAQGDAAELNSVMESNATAEVVAGAPAPPADLGQLVQTFGDQLTLNNGKPPLSEGANEVKTARQAVTGGVAGASLSLTVQ